LAIFSGDGKRVGFWFAELNEKTWQGSLHKLAQAVPILQNKLYFYNFSRSRPEQEGVCA